MANTPPPPVGGRATGGMGMSRSGADTILDDCSAIDRTITDLESRLASFRALQARILSDRANLGEAENAASDIMASYRNLAQRMKNIKSLGESGLPRNAPQVGRVDRRLKASMTEFQRVESEFRGKMREQQARQYLIVNPNATEDEVQQAVEDPGANVFQQAVSSVLRASPPFFCRWRR
jgi:syntaxin 1B/2/3